MRNEIWIAVGLYVLVLFATLGCLVFLVQVHGATNLPTTWIEELVGKIVGIIEFIVGGAVGALSTAMAFAFSKSKEAN